MKKCIQFQRGLSLIELMISMILGIVVTAGVIEIFANSKEMYQIHDGRTQLQENGRFAIQLLSNKIRTAGYNGCSTRAASVAVTNTLDSTAYIWDFNNFIQGVESTGSNVWTPSLDASVGSPISGTDVLTVRGIANESMIKVTNHAPDSSSELTITGGSGLKQYDIVMVSDCLAAAIFQITSSTGDDSIEHNTGPGIPGNVTEDLGKIYNDADIIKLITTSYFIQDNDNGVPSLFQTVLSDAPQELVEGVENMQLLYGVANDGDEAIDQYQAANAVSNWNNVKSVRISLLLRSLEDNLTVDGPQKYLFSNAIVTPTDNHLRAVYTRTITLRNSVP